MRRLAFVGNSHVITLFEGFQLSGGQLPEGMELAFIAQEQSRIGCAVASTAGVKRPEVRTSLAQLVGDLDATDVFLMWLGSQMNVRGLLLLGPGFDVVLPGDGDREINPRLELIPCSVVDAVVRESLETDEQLPDVIDRAHRAGRNVWLLAPPPPLPDAAVRERLGNETHFARTLGEAGISAVDVEIVPAPVRVRLYSILVGTYRAYAAAHGCAFCPAPDRAADAYGVLLPRYWGEDITHASAAYGAAYLQEMLTAAGVPNA